MDEQKQMVLSSEEAIIRLGSEAKRMKSMNDKLDEVGNSFRDAMGELALARLELSSIEEKSVNLNVKIEGLVEQLQEKNEALETRLRGMDLELNSVRKSLDLLDIRIRDFESSFENSNEDQKKVKVSVRANTYLLLVSIVVSISIAIMVAIL